MIVYFSGTGNSRFCAQFLAHALNDTCFDVFSLIRQGIALELTSEKPWVFVSPTYGWQLPGSLPASSKAAGFPAAGRPTLS